jgi:hypothetical protein
METLTIHPENSDQLEAVKAVLKALKIPFERQESPYDNEFVKKILDAEKDRPDATVLNNDDDINNYFNSLANNVQD